MYQLPLDPMRFGTEKDLDLALTELKWIKNMNGKLTESNFEVVAVKYCFPVDFLKEGLGGFSYPHDYMISKSKWFPIMYKWRKHFQSLQWQFFKLNVNYMTAGARFFAVLFSLISIALVAVYHGSPISLVIPIITVGISISLWFLKLMIDAKSKLDEFFNFFKSECPNEKVFISAVRWTLDFINQDSLRAYILSKKEKAFIPMSFFQIGKTKFPVRTKKRLLAKLIPSPRFTSQVETTSKFVEVPIVLAENPDLAYAQRLKNMATSSQGK